MLRRLRPTALAGALAVLGIGLVAFVVVMSQSDYRRNGTNSKVVGIPVDLPYGKEVCQPQQFLPAGTGAVGLRVDPTGVGAGPMEVRVRDQSGLVASGHSGTGFGHGLLVTQFRRVDHAVNDVSVCVRNRGAVVVEVQGEAGPGGAGYAVTDVSVPAPLVLHVDWLRPGRQTHWQEVGAVVERFPLQKASWFGTWTFWAVLALLLALSAAGIRLAAGEPQR